MKAYKVFRKLKNGALVSSGTLPKCMRQCYSRTKNNISKFVGGELFCFAELECAKEYKKNFGKEDKIEVWEVDVPKLTPRQKIPNVWHIQDNIRRSSFEVRHFWLNNPNFKHLELGFAVDNCYSSPSVKLIKRVV